MKTYLGTPNGYAATLATSGCNCGTPSPGRTPPLTYFSPTATPTTAGLLLMTLAGLRREDKRLQYASQHASQTLTCF